VAPRQLGDEPFITYSADLQLRELQLSALAHHGVKPRRLHAADSAETILGFVAAGLGYSLLASLLPKGPRVPGVIAQPITQPAREFAIYAAWRKSAHANPLLTVLLSLAPQP
jgi:DNA-binding transcriptional LysR family regulator